jgi:hypothetical protein
LSTALPVPDKPATVGARTHRPIAIAHPGHLHAGRVAQVDNDRLATTTIQNIDIGIDIAALDQ